MFLITLAIPPICRGGKAYNGGRVGAGKLNGLECIDLIITDEVTFRLII